MVRDCDSGGTSGVEMSHFVSPSLPYLPSPYLKKFGWQMFGTPKVKRVVGPLGSLRPLMIRNWKLWNVFLLKFKQLGCTRIWVTK